MLLNDGELDGARVLSEEAARLVITNQLPVETIDNKENGHGLGGAVDLTTKEYSWGGAASTTFCIDPENRMIIITGAQLMPSDNSYANDFKDWVKKALK